MKMLETDIEHCLRKLYIVRFYCFLSVNYFTELGGRILAVDKLGFL